MFTAKFSILTRIDGQPAGKTFSLAADGTLQKSVAGHSGRYHARTISVVGDTPEATLAAFAAHLEALEPHQLIVLAYAPAAGDAPYRVVPLAEHGGEDSPRMVAGMLQMPRTKRNFAPSRLLLLDYDDDGTHPPAWRERDGRWALFEEAVPEFAACARLHVPSSSGRVTNASATASEHTYVLQDAEPSVAELDTLRTRLLARLWAAGLGVTRASASGARLRRTIFDTSVFCTGREVFAGPPAVQPPLSLAPFSGSVIPGGTARPLPPVSEPERERCAAASGLRIAAHGRVPECVIDTSALTLDSVLDVKGRGRMTVAAALEAGLPHGTRCQAPFRESASWAGIVNRERDGGLSVYDFGLGTLYRLNVPATELPDTFAESVDRLKTLAKPDAAAFARSVAWRFGSRVPLRMSAEAFVATLEAAAGQPLPEVHRILALQASRIKQRVEAVTELPGAREVTDIGEVLDFARSAPPGTVIAVKAPHGTGKTQHLLRPLALECEGGVVAVAPRVSLVADLAERLKLTNYQTCADSVKDIALCVNSFCNPRFRAPIDGASMLLIDEGETVIRECHRPGGTMKTQGGNIFRAMVEKMQSAGLSVLADADLSQETVDILARASGKPVETFVIREEGLDLSARLTADVGSVMAGVEASVAAGEKVLFAADSAKHVVGLAETLEKRFPGKKILAIHAKPGLATTGTEAVLQFLQNADAEVERYDAVLYSPSIESGISVNRPWFTSHFAIYTGVVAPTSFNQMLRRDRTAEQWTIAVAGTGRKNLPDTYGETLNSLDAARRYCAIASDGEYVVSPLTAFDNDTCRLQASENAALNVYAPYLAELLTQRGWRVQWEYGSAGRPGKEALADTRAAFESAERDAILAAADINGEQAEQLSAQYAVAPADSAALAKFRVRQALGMDEDEDVEAEHVERWGSGRLSGQIRRFELLLRQPGEPSPADVAEKDAPPSLRRLDIATATALQILFILLGLDTATGSGSFDEATARRAFEALASGEESGTLTRAGFCRFNRQPKSAIRWVSGIFRKMGLSLERQRHGHAGGAGSTYSIRQDETRHNGRLTTPGWAVMMSIAAARAARKRGDVTPTTDMGMVPDENIFMYTPASDTHSQHGFSRGLAV